MTERIIAAAIRTHDKMVFSMLPPARHGECFTLMNACRPDCMGKEEQGFVTSHNRFVDRIEAKRIATEAGQLIERAMRLPELYSEDLW